ncbi:hypothetical protein [Mesorhizobium australicum]
MEQRFPLLSALLEVGILFDEMPAKDRQFLMLFAEAHAHRRARA